MSEYKDSGNIMNNTLSEFVGDSQEATQVVYIDIDNLEANPKNFYGMRDIDALAGLIAVSHFIEPLTVIKKADGRYRIVAGHRRFVAVQKLLEEGVYNERNLPCIVKARQTIKIEQENGEIVEFDEDAVEMLNMIASNRGQREERTVDEKLQEIKYLEVFARAIYNQKDKGIRGRFRSFFAEEILNISKSQLQRLNSMSNLTDRVKQAVDAKQISDTAAQEMTSMTTDDQDECLEEILSGEMKGTVQDIQKFKQLKINDEVIYVDNQAGDAEVTTAEECIQYTDSSVSAFDEKVEEPEVKLTYPKNLLPKNESEKISVGKIIDVPEEFDDPQKEAEDWFYQERLSFYETMSREAKRLSEAEPNELKAAQWEIRASVARYHVEELKLQHGAN